MSNAPLLDLLSVPTISPLSDLLMGTSRNAKLAKFFIGHPGEWLSSEQLNAIDPDHYRNVIPDLRRRCWGMCIKRRFLWAADGTKHRQYCYFPHGDPRSQVDRFWERVDRSCDCCWLWRGPTNACGYGTTPWDGRQTGTTAIAWFLTSGEWPPDGKYLCHRCDTPPCVRPSHLFVGTQADNIHDCMAKGRFAVVPRAQGAAHHKAKLTWEQVAEIRRRHAAGESSLSLSRVYGLASSSMQRITSGEGWKEKSRP